MHVHTFLYKQHRDMDIQVFLYVMSCFKQLQKNKSGYFCFIPSFQVNCIVKQTTVKLNNADFPHNARQRMASYFKR